MRARTLGLLAALAALLTACGAPSAAFFPTFDSRTEILAYFPAETPAVAVVATDPGSDQARALAAALRRAGALARLERLAKRHGLHFAQVRRLLGNDMAIGIPARGKAALVVLVADDRDALHTLVDARVTARRATFAGAYRGADLYATRGLAFAVRDRVLLVSDGTDDLRDALDRRAGGGTLTLADLGEALPEVKGDPLVRAMLDAGAELPARAREVPWLAAWERLGGVLRAGNAGATLDLRLTTLADDLLEVDVPVSPGKRPPLAVTSAKAASVTVRDLAHVLGVAERAARAAAPLTVLRLDRARRTLRHRGGVDLGADVVGRLHGPATLIRTHRHLLLRADPSRPRPLGRALDRVAKVLPAALERARVEGFAVRERRGFLELLRDGEVVGRLGMAGDVLVAGTASPAALRALARVPLARPAGAEGAVTASASRDVIAGWSRERLGAPLPWRLDGWARGAREELRGALHLAW